MIWWVNLQPPLLTLLPESIHPPCSRTGQIYTLKTGSAAPAVSLNHRARCAANCCSERGISNTQPPDLSSVCLYRVCVDRDVAGVTNFLLRLPTPGMPLSTLQSS